MKKRLLSILTTLALCLTLLPTAVWAASTPETLTFDISEGPVTITDGTTPGKIRVAYGANQSTGDIDPSNMITVTGRTVNENRGLVIKTTTPVTVKTDNLHIDNSGVEFAYAMALAFMHSMDRHRTVAVRVRNRRFFFICVPPSCHVYLGPVRAAGQSPVRPALRCSG